MNRTLALLAATAVLLIASDRSLELRGTVTGEGYNDALRVQLFSVETPYTALAAINKHGEFRFRALAPGNYTLAVVRSGLGEIRRTVVVSPALADARGVIRTEIEYSAGDAAMSGGPGLVSLRALSVPEQAREKYGAAQGALARRDPAAAVKLFEEAAAIAPQFSAAWNALGVIAFQEGDAEAAERHFRRSLQAEPGAFEATVNLGGLLLRSGRAEEALGYNQRAAAGRPKDALANAQLGMTLFRLGRFDEAEPYLQSARKADPAHHTQPQLFLAEILMRRGDREGAIRELQELMEKHPDSPTAAGVRASIEALRR